MKFGYFTLCFSYKVIGNKQGGHTSAITPYEVFSYLEELKKLTGIPIRLIHVVRNPFDNIATIALRRAHGRNTVRNNTRKVTYGKTISVEIDRVTDKSNFSLQYQGFIS